MWECHFSVVQLEGGGFTVSQDSTQPRIAVCNLHNQADWYHSSFPPRLAVEFDGIGLASHVQGGGIGAVALAVLYTFQERLVRCMIHHASLVVWLGSRLTFGRLH